MKSDDTKPILFRIFAADTEYNDRLSAVDKVLFVAHMKRIAKHVLRKTCIFRQFNGCPACLSLCLGSIKKCRVALCIRKDLFGFLFACQFKNVLLFVGRLFIKICSLLLFFRS